MEFPPAGDAAYLKKSRKIFHLEIQESVDGAAKTWRMAGRSFEDGKHERTLNAIMVKVWDDVLGEACRALSCCTDTLMMSTCELNMSLSPPLTCMLLLVPLSVATVGTDVTRYERPARK